MSIVGCWLNFPLREKKGKDDFDRVIKKCIDKASKLHVKKVKVDIFVWWEILMNGCRFCRIRITVDLLGQLFSIPKLAFNDAFY